MIQLYWAKPKAKAKAKPKAKAKAKAKGLLFLSTNSNNLFDELLLSKSLLLRYAPPPLKLSL